MLDELYDIIVYLDRVTSCVLGFAYAIEMSTILLSESCNVLPDQEYIIGQYTLLNTNREFGLVEHLFDRVGIDESDCRNRWQAWRTEGYVME